MFIPVKNTQNKYRVFSQMMSEVVTPDYLHLTIYWFYFSQKYFYYVLQISVCNYIRNINAFAIHIYQSLRL